MPRLLFTRVCPEVNASRIRTASCTTGRLQKHKLAGTFFRASCFKAFVFFSIRDMWALERYFDTNEEKYLQLARDKRHGFPLWAHSNGPSPPFDPLSIEHTEGAGDL